MCVPTRTLPPQQNNAPQSNSELKALDLTQNVMSPLFVQRKLAHLKARVRASFQRAPVMEGEGEEDEADS